MELGSGGLEWFVFVPTWNGNRELPEEERLSLEIRRLRPVDLLAEFEESRETLLRWRDAELKTWLDSAEDGPQIRRFGPQVLQSMRLFVEHTRVFRNFLLDGRPMTDPREVFLRLPIPMGDRTETGLTAEINVAIKGTAGLSADELKNYVAQCSGTPPATIPTTMAAPTVLPATVAGEPCAASIPGAPTG